MKTLIFILMCYVALGVGGCEYKTQSVTTGAGSGSATINNNDQDGSVIVDARDNANVNANQGSDTNDTNNEEIGGIPLNPSTASGFTTDPCKSSDGQPVSGKTCASRTADLSDK